MAVEIKFAPIAGEAGSPPFNIEGKGFRAPTLGISYDEVHLGIALFRDPSAKF